MPADLSFGCPAVASTQGYRSTVHRNPSCTYWATVRKIYTVRRPRQVLPPQARHVLYTSYSLSFLHLVDNPHLVEDLLTSKPVWLSQCTGEVDQGM